MQHQKTMSIALRRLSAITLATSLLPAMAQTKLADQALFSSISVPGNLALALSVEYPTAISVAHKDGNYSSATNYIGYFDPAKCYQYNYNSNESLRYFSPVGKANNRVCNGYWSGNFMNWATMQAIDPFRWALTGGYRSTDDETTTILEKAWASNQGTAAGNFPDRTLNNSTTIAGATPFKWDSLNLRVWSAGNKLKFSNTGNVSNNSATFDPSKAGAMVSATVYDVSVRVKVCDASGGIGMLEANCTQYSATSYKPTGLMQRYSNQIRYSAFGYLNDSNLLRDGGVLRAQQKFIGPTQPVIGSNTPASNGLAEWSASTGVINNNPNPTDAADTESSAGFNVSINNSGVMNYLNKFGEINKSSYKGYDPVGELYYAVLRYYKNQGNVSEWSTPGTADAATRSTWADGFPVITKWNDPVQYSCQKNFILGIGDTNTHADRDLPGSTGGSNTEPTKPAAVANDTTLDTVSWTNKVGTMAGITNLGTKQNYNGCCSNNGALMAGMAYYANTQDIRPDLAGRQSMQTYWLDVLESGYANNNQFFLAAKYGGFTVSDTFDVNRTADIPLELWHTGPASDANNGQPRPDNYFTAARADLMVDGLTKAFASIASKLRSSSTGFVTASPVVNATGQASYATQYDTSDWSGDVIASQAVFETSTNSTTTTTKWSFSAKLASADWTTRVIATYNTATKKGVLLDYDKLSSDQQTAVKTAYRGNDGKDYVNYLRGDRTNEKSSTTVNSAKAYRDRSSLVGDIVGAKAVVVGTPSNRFSEAANPGYAAFKAKSRKTMVYVGTNRGMLHAIDGNLTGDDSGTELFAYVPGSLYQGPTGTPATNGLQAIGNPNFVHYNFVDATPAIFDIDFGRAGGNSGAADWRSVLVGGLGKGGKSYYAIDVTDPSSFKDNPTSKVLWEFSHPKLGYTYGQPVAVKTRKYGWVLIFGSGYNNDGKGYFFIVDPRNGTMLTAEPIEAKFPNGSSGSDGLAHVQSFVLDLTDGTADAVYAGDLLGNLWRLELTDKDGNYKVQQIAELRDSAGKSVPITSRVLPVTQPGTGRRFITAGTGQLLHADDIGSTQDQSFFAIIDGTAASFGKESGLPKNVSYPIKRANLKELTSLTQKVTLDFSTQVGWYLDIKKTGAGPGWRVITDPIAFFGAVAFTAMAPTSSDVCQAGGVARVYAIDLGTGVSTLDGPEPYLSYLNVPTEIAFYAIGGKPYLAITKGSSGSGQDEGGGGKSSLDLREQKKSSNIGVRRLNWREVALGN